MKITELIKKLEEIAKEHPDADVTKYEGCLNPFIKRVLYNEQDNEVLLS